MCGSVRYGTLRVKGENGCSFSLGKSLMILVQGNLHQALHGHACFMTLSHSQGCKQV